MRTHNSTGDYTEWAIRNPLSDMWSYIYAQTPASVADPPADGGDAIANSGV